MTNTIQRTDDLATLSRGFIAIAGADIRRGDFIRAELPMSTYKAIEYIAEKDADHKGTDCVHWRREHGRVDPEHLGVGAVLTTDRPANHNLPWAPPLIWWHRCKARRAYDGTTPHFGRCELRRGHDGDHALERGMDVPRWSTEWTA